ncbi:MAG: MurR/RpiR family transcriptional regulator [Pseudomonadota bacterium]
MSETIVPTAADAEAVLQRLRQVLPTLSPQLRKAARYVLTHPGDVAVSSIGELAQAAGVTANTLVRVARTVGFDGFDGLRMPFREALRQAPLSIPDRARWLQGVAEQGRHGELLTDMAGGSLTNVESLFGALSTARVRAAAGKILGARTCLVLGVGVARQAAQNFAYLAGMALPSVTAIPREGGLPVDDLLRAGADDVLIAMTFEPYRTEVVQSVELAHRQGATVIAISDSAASPIAAAASDLFLVPTESPQFFTSTVALTALLETLLAFVIADAPLEVVRSIERFHARRHEVGVYYEDRSH